MGENPSELLSSMPQPIVHFMTANPPLLVFIRNAQPLLILNVLAVLPTALLIVVMMWPEILCDKGNLPLFSHKPPGIMHSCMVVGYACILFAPPPSTKFLSQRRLSEYANQPTVYPCIMTFLLIRVFELIEVLLTAALFDVPKWAPLICRISCHGVDPP